jgi:hypothetical protein
MFSDEFDDEKSLLEVQKTPKNIDDLVINFNEEPNKSQKQLSKLITLISTHVQTRTSFLHSINSSSDQSLSQIKDLFDHSHQMESCDSEEKAILLFNAFGKVTSILYDIQSICELLKK